MQVRFLFLLLFASLGPWGFAQQGGAAFQGLRFYEQLALRDAAYEASLHVLTNQDAQDYWIDQRNYERKLGKVNFSAYLAYKRQKKTAYYQHLQNCNTSCGHGPEYYAWAQDYLSSSDFGDILEASKSKVTQNLATRKNR
ncbi:hypothetical protein GTQ34_11750 [Muricauda sp. JGD-17]|uniref:Uncharacterized protein n=1 Tax=Flagellimonas ochracea TaxID=2696472 RepID=A0A964TCX7_9FLAO|nr:hypothetical protein [Allomuricauda ochracea]NAY92592.1 hypothetical protein [Allomuricauda ochracea]